MNCPICEKQVLISEKAIFNVIEYKHSAVARTLCCKKLVRVIPIITYGIKTTTREGVDDWGE